MAGNDLKGRVALITGGREGMGRATAELFAEKLASGGVTESLLSEIQKHVDRMNPLHPDNSPKEVKDLVQVEADFNAQMDAIEKDGDELEKNINTQLDQVDIDSTRQAINEVK